MKDIIDTIGRVITSPYPYFGLLGFLGWKAYDSIIGNEPNYYQILSLILVYIFLGFLSILVYVLIRKVGHVSMLPPDIQLQLEQSRLNNPKRQDTVLELKASAGEEETNE